MVGALLAVAAIKAVQGRLIEIELVV